MSKKRSVVVDEVLPMTASLFTKTTKNHNSTAQEQETAIVDRLALVRHGERQDHVEKSWKGNALLPLYDPPLSTAGRRQSFETALQYWALQQDKRLEERLRGTFSHFIVSPFYRCLETAVLINIVAFEGRLAMDVNPELADWQQSKVYRTAPTLAGYYSVPGRRQEQAGELLFVPPVEALRTYLLPFLEARAEEDHNDDSDDVRNREEPVDEHVGSKQKKNGNHARESSAKPKSRTDTASTKNRKQRKWVACLERWLDTHPSLPVWTSLATETHLRADILALKPGVMPAKSEGNTHESDVREGTVASPSAAVAAEQPKKPAAGRKSPQSQSQAQQQQQQQSRKDPFVWECGVPYPENKSDLVQRCGRFVATHFARDDVVSNRGGTTAAEEIGASTLVPKRVLAAAQRERREKLPKYFQTLEEQPRAVREAILSDTSSHCAGSPGFGCSDQALLPAMNVMTVTHADVVAGVLQACCSSYRLDSAGFAVPYCSVTTLTRRNNFYRIPPAEERGGTSTTANVGGGRKKNVASEACQRNKGTGGAAQTPETAATTPQARTTQWGVVEVGSLDLVKTRIVIHYKS